MAIVDTEALAERARNLGALNGFRLVLVSILPGDQAQLEAHFHNANGLAAIVAAVAGDPALARGIFPITGGVRRRAGAAAGQVQVTAVAATAAANVLNLTVAPVGDYSTYRIAAVHPSMDALPALCEVRFKFRPGCFSTECAPCAAPGRAAAQPAAIDYLAKDYESFRHTLIAAMSRRVPGWTPSSEADLDQTLIELLSAAGDELSDFQDRVMNEAYLGTSRKRVSLARHARLVDYHIHQGNQASTWLVLELASGSAGNLPAGVVAWAGGANRGPDSQVFVTRDAVVPVHYLLNAMRLYTWSGAQPALEAGATHADLALAETTQVAADTVRDLICNGHVTRLLVEEALNPATGFAAGSDPRKRQLLRLRACGAGMAEPGAESIRDPLTGRWLVRVRWLDEDRLRFNYCGLIDCPPPVGRVDGVSLFHGNLVRASHGTPRRVRFLDPGANLAGPDDFHYVSTRPGDDETDEPGANPCCKDSRAGGSPGGGALCRLPDALLAYRDTPPGGEVPPRSTLAVRVADDGIVDGWDERISLVQSGSGAEDGDHFVVETDEERVSVIRFGHEGHGRDLPENAIVSCDYQFGEPLAGNVGADTVVHLDRHDVAFPAWAAGERMVFQALLASASVWNPFDVSDARAPESAAEVIRIAPEAFRFRQLRAVTLEDYVRRAEEVEGVARAAASYAWTGSWRTVRITLDPRGTSELGAALRDRVAAYLESVRLIGEDLEIRAPRYVPLDVRLAVCASPGFWPQDVAAALREEFSDGFTADGRPAFFNPDRFTFGQPLHASEIAGRAQAVTGVEHVMSLTMKRWNDPAAASDAMVGLRPDEIILVEGDPDNAERGFIDIGVFGGIQ